MYSLYFLYLLSLDAVGGHILVVSIGIVRTIGDCPSLRGEGKGGRGKGEGEGEGGERGKGEEGERGRGEGRGGKGESGR